MTTKSNGRHSLGFTLQGCDLFGPTPLRGPKVSLKTGSVITRNPLTSNNTVECPNHVALISFSLKLEP